MADTYEFVHTNLEQAAGKQKKYDRGLKQRTFPRSFCLEMISSNCYNKIRLRMDGPL